MGAGWDPQLSVYYFGTGSQATTVLFQIEAKGTLDGEKVEHQRTTFVKQLKLGKVRLPPQCLCCGVGGGMPHAVLQS